MRVIQGTTDFEFDFPTAITIGKFDGLHRGHQKLIHTMKQAAGEQLKTVVFTFDVQPTNVLNRKYTPVLTTVEEKRRMMEALRVDILIEYPFTETTCRMEAEEFVREVLVKQLNAKLLAVGPDCGFGYQRKGNVSLLEELSHELGYSLLVVEKERTEEDNLPISSSRIKHELKNGNVEEANRMLGYVYNANERLKAMPQGDL